MNPHISDDVIAGQAVYTRTVLGVYDLAVIGVFLPLVWKCPAAAILDLYDNSVSANHLDCGVGTGFFLDRCVMPPKPRVVLVDLNPNALAKAARRLRRYEPRTYLRNVLEPLSINEARFDSIGLNFLLHCLPGTMRDKAVAFDRLATYLNPGGCVFGSTILHEGLPIGAAARWLMARFNARRIFCNESDHLDGLRSALELRFRKFDVETNGCVARFRAWV